MQFNFLTKSRFVLLLLSFAYPATFSQIVFSQDTATFYIVRHADRDGKNDALTNAGLDRAEKLKQIMIHLNVDSVYSTDLNRTKGTVGPTAKAIGVKTKLYGRTTQEWFEELKRSNRGKVVLIAGHSNTVVPIVNGLGARLEYRIAENEYDNLFVVQVRKNKTSVVQLKYGKKAGSAD